MAQYNAEEIEEAFDSAVNNLSEVADALNKLVEHGFIDQQIEHNNNVEFDKLHDALTRVHSKWEAMVAEAWRQYDLKQAKLKNESISCNVSGDVPGSN